MHMYADMSIGQAHNRKKAEIARENKRRQEEANRINAEVNCNDAL